MEGDSRNQKHTNPVLLPLILLFAMCLVLGVILITCGTIKQDGAKEASKASGSLISESFLPLCPAVREGHNTAGHEVHEYEGFTLCYRESYEEAEWVCYTLTPARLVKNAGRTDDFREDPAITTGSAALSDYKGSGYDRGHLSPARDNAWSISAMSESFLMSNMTPQMPDFNRGIWNDLEQAVRVWAGGAVSCRVVTGPVLNLPPSGYKSIGKNKVAVPDYFYKALLLEMEDGTFKAAGFVLPNQKCEGDVSDYEVSVDEVERITGLDFFSDLEDTLENSVESYASPL